MKCYHCKGDHRTVDDVRFCATGIRAISRSSPQPYQALAPFDKQLRLIDTLAYQKGLTGKLNPAQSRSQASQFITYLKRQPDVSNPLAPKPVINFAIVNMIKLGRYAVTVDIGDSQEYVFFRVSRPEKGKSKDMLKVQTQHGGSWTTRLHYDSQGSLVFQNTRMVKGYSLAELLTLIVVDQGKAALDYGAELEQCSCCGRSLTDERSRWYSIGPECEKDWPSYINYVNETKGIYAGV